MYQHVVETGPRSLQGMLVRIEISIQSGCHMAMGRIAYGPQAGILGARGRVIEPGWRTKYRS
jgi:hypothetical protein